MDRNVEKFMRKVFRQSIKDDIYYKAMIESLEFWQAFDYISNSNFAKIFKRIYMSDCGNSSIIRQSLENHVSERTLFRYRKDFIKMFRYLIEFLQNYNRNRNLTSDNGIAKK